MLDAPSINAFKGRLDTLRQTRVSSSLTNPLSFRPYRMIDSPVRPHNVRYKVRHMWISHTTPHDYTATNKWEATRNALRITVLLYTKNNCINI